MAMGWRRRLVFAGRFALVSTVSDLEGRSGLADAEQPRGIDGGKDDKFHGRVLTKWNAAEEFVKGRPGVRRRRPFFLIFVACSSRGRW